MTVPTLRENSSARLRNSSAVMIYPSHRSELRCWEPQAAAVISSLVVRIMRLTAKHNAQAVMLSPGTTMTTDSPQARFEALFGASP